MYSGDRVLEKDVALVGFGPPALGCRRVCSRALGSMEAITRGGDVTARRSSPPLRSGAGAPGHHRRAPRADGANKPARRPP